MRTRLFPLSIPAAVFPLELVKIAGTTTALALTAGSGVLLGTTLRLLKRPDRPAGSPEAPFCPPPTPESGSTPGGDFPPAAAFAAGPQGAADLERFLDGFFEREGVGRDIQSAAFVMVKEGRVFFQKTYGSAGASGTPGSERPFTVASSTNVYLATLADLGRLLLAFLASSLAESAPAGIRSGLYRHRFAQHPFIRDAVFGLFETCIGRRRTLFHTGGSPGRAAGGPDCAPGYTLLYLLPEEKMGFYVVVTGATEARAFSLRTRLVQKLLDRYYPAE